MLLESTCVPLESIEFTATWNLHPWELYSLSDDLVASFSQAGILHPPILQAKGSSRFEVVCGFKRLLFAASVLHLQSINCLILAEQVKPAVVLDIILTDQHLTQPLSMAEKARFLKICNAYLPQQEILDTYCDRLMLDKRPSTFRTMLRILKQHPLLISEVHRGALQDKMVLELLKLPSDSDRIALIGLFKKLSLGDGKQRKFFPLIRDLAFGNDMSIAAFLEQSSIWKILDHPEMNLPQKTQHLASLLQRQLNPRSIEAEKEFARQVNSLEIPDNCSITHSPFFEKDEVTVSITFKDFAICKAWLPALKKSLT